WVIGFGVRFRAFLGLPNLTKFYQFLPKVCSEGRAKGLEEAVKRESFATDLFKPCQVRRIVSSRKRRTAVLVPDLEEARGKSSVILVRRIPPVSPH
ncbi:MAG: hypothetical protein ACLQOO_35715, partial [Terriglobia bacterium]